MTINTHKMTKKKQMQSGHKETEDDYKEAHKTAHIKRPQRDANHSEKDAKGPKRDAKHSHREAKDYRDINWRQDNAQKETEIDPLDTIQEKLV